MIIEKHPLMVPACLHSGSALHTLERERSVCTEMLLAVCVFSSGPLARPLPLSEVVERLAGHPVPAAAHFAMRWSLLCLACCTNAGKTKEREGSRRWCTGDT